MPGDYWNKNYWQQNWWNDNWWHHVVVVPIKTVGFAVRFAVKQVYQVLFNPEC